MTALTSPVRQRTPEWIEERRRHIGSSDAQVLAGERGSVVQLWAEKMGLVDPSFDDDTEDIMEIGALLEPALRSLYVARMERPIRQRHGLVISRDWPVAAASLDAESGRRIVETKWSHSAEWYAAIAEGSPDPVPPKVMAQVQWQMYVTRRDVADVAVLLGRKFEVIEVGRDDGYIDNLVYVARWFWPYVERGEQPPVDGLEATTRALRDLWPQDNGGWLPSTPELVDLVRRYAAAKAIAKDTDAAAVTLGNEIRALLKDWTGITGLVSHKRNAPSEETDWRALAYEIERVVDHVQEWLVGSHEVTEERVRELLTEWSSGAIHKRHTHMKPGPRVLRLMKGATA